MKGQINLEFLSSAFIYLLALGGILFTASSVMPDLSDTYEQRSMNLEANSISNLALTSQGDSSTAGNDWHTGPPEDVTEFGLAASEPYTVERDKVESLQSFTVNTGSSDLNYSRFKNLTDAGNQYRFIFTRKPTVHLEKSLPVKVYNDTAGFNSTLRGYWRMEEISGSIPDHARPFTPLSADSGVKGMKGALRTEGAEMNFSEKMSTATDYNFSSATLMFWVKPREPGSSQQWITGLKDGSDFYGVVLDDHRLKVMDNLSGTPEQSFNEEFPKNEWVQVALRRNSSGISSLYINGVERNSSNILGADFKGEVWIGSLGGSSYNYEGGVDEVRIYNHSLTQSRIRQVYRGMDRYSELNGEPVKLPFSSPIISGGTIVRYGSKFLPSGTKHFLAATNSGNFDSAFVSDDQDFTGETAFSEGYALNPDTNVSSIGSRGRYIILSELLNRFGPEPGTDESPIKLDRYGVMNSEILRMEVLVW